MSPPQPSDHPVFLGVSSSSKGKVLYLPSPTSRFGNNTFLNLFTHNTNAGTEDAAKSLGMHQAAVASNEMSLKECLRALRLTKLYLTLLVL